MVHKKSEYRLQFHLLSNELRKQIWQDNVKFREGRRSVNRADHYWADQLTDEKCECENIDDEDEGAVLPPHRLKHKALLARYGADKLERDILEAAPKPFSSPSPPSPPSPPSKPKEAWVQRQVQLKAPETDVPSARERAVQTPDWGAEEFRTTDDPSHELQNMMQNLNTSSTGDVGHSKKEREQHTLPSALRWIERPLPVAEASRHRPTSALVYREDPRSIREDPRSIGRRPQSRCSDDSRRHLSPSRFSSLSRTSRKSYYEEKKSPFVSYGWNDAETDIGEKKTYNVAAPRNEVHPPALKAMKRRKADIQQYLLQESERLREIQTSKNSINNSAIWMSEYQEKYNCGAYRPLHTDRIVRPISAPILKKPVCWRYS